MKVSNRVRRNICFALLLVGLSCIAARAWEVIVTPGSGKAWFELCSIIFLTGGCFSRYRILQKRLKRGIMFGTGNVY